MKKFLLATTCLVALGSAVGTGYAADLPAKAAPYAPPLAPVVTWTGGYVGGHLGVARMNSSCTPGAADAYAYYSCGYTNSLNLNDTGFAGGIHAGYDWQMDRSFVVGVVADWTWTGLDRTISLSYGSYKFNPKIDWLASFRGRMGLAFDQTLVYFTGGVALGKVSATSLNTSSGVSYSPMDKTQVGWVAGLGVEHKFSPGRAGWAVNAELLYYDLGHVTGETTISSSTTYRNEYNFEVFEARLGASYRF